MHHLFYCLLAYRPQRQEETSLHAGSAIDTATQYLFCVCVCLFELQFLGQNIYTDVDFPHGADKNMCDKKICDKTLYEKVHPRKKKLVKERHARNGAVKKKSREFFFEFLIPYINELS